MAFGNKGNRIDNLSSRFHRKIDNNINAKIWANKNVGERSVARYRSGFIDSGSIILKNIVTSDYAMFGEGGSGIVGP